MPSSVDAIETISGIVVLRCFIHGLIKNPFTYEIFIMIVGNNSDNKFAYSFYANDRYFPG